MNTFETVFGKIGLCLFAILFIQASRLPIIFIVVLILLIVVLQAKRSKKT